MKSYFETIQVLKNDEEISTASSGVLTILSSKSEAIESWLHPEINQYHGSVSSINSLKISSDGNFIVLGLDNRT